MDNYCDVITVGEVSLVGPLTHRLPQHKGIELRGSVLTGWQCRLIGGEGPLTCGCGKWAVGNEWLAAAPQVPQEGKDD